MKTEQLQLCVIKANSISELDEGLAHVVNNDLAHIIDAYVISDNPLHNDFELLDTLQKVLHCTIIYEAEPLINGGLDELSKVRQQKDFNNALSKYTNIIDSRKWTNYMESVPIMGSNYLEETRHDVLDLRNFKQGITLVEVFI